MSDTTPDLTHALTVFFKALVDAERLQIAGLLARKPRVLPAFLELTSVF